jgi:hypothetical protein
VAVLVEVDAMTRQEEASMTLSVWQQVRHLPPEERIKQIDDQIRMDSLLKHFFQQVREDEYEVQLRLVSEEMSCVITNCSSSLPPSAHSSSAA